MTQKRNEGDFMRKQRRENVASPAGGKAGAATNRRRERRFKSGMATRTDVCFAIGSFRRRLNGQRRLHSNKNDMVRK